ARTGRTALTKLNFTNQTIASNRLIASDPNPMHYAETPSSGFRVFRAGEAKSFAEAGVMSAAGLSPVIEAGLETILGLGAADGVVAEELVGIPGFSLARAWFKSGFPLPLHSHDVDCLYHVLAGSLKLGSQWLEAGDGIFIPAHTPYRFTPGTKGVEVLEFRHETHFQ